MRNRKRYPKNWRQRARAVKELAGWKCAKCGVEHGTVRRSIWTGNEWPVWLQAAHVNHDPGNEEAELICVCPRCHWHYCRGPGQLPQWMLEKIKHRMLIMMAYLS